MDMQWIPRASGASNFNYLWNTLKIGVQNCEKWFYCRPTNRITQYMPVHVQLIERFNRKFLPYFSPGNRKRLVPFFYRFESFYISILFFFENEIISHEIVREKRYRIFDKIKLFFERIYISSWWKTTLEFFKILLNNFLITVREERKEERISWKSWAKEVGEKKYRIAPSVFPKSLNLIRRTPFLLVERFIGRNETRCCFVFPQGEKRWFGEYHEYKYIFQRIFLSFSCKKFRILKLKQIADPRQFVWPTVAFTAIRVA